MGTDLLLRNDIKSLVEGATPLKLLDLRILNNSCLGIISSILERSFDNPFCPSN